MRGSTTSVAQHVKRAALVPPWFTLIDQGVMGSLILIAVRARMLARVAGKVSPVMAKLSDLDTPIEPALPQIYERVGRQLDVTSIVYEAIVAADEDRATLRKVAHRAVSLVSDATSARVCVYAHSRLWAWDADRARVSFASE